MFTAAALLLAAVPLAFAKTDLTGCTSTVNGPVVTWYVPGTGELCDFLDCGGGRAPVKTTVPGCPAYVGTATYSPSYLPGYGPNGQAPPASASATSPAGSAPAVVGSGSTTVPPVITPTPITPSGSVLTSVVTYSSGKLNITYTSSGPVTQSTNGAANMGAPVVGGILLGAAALVL